MTARRLGPLTPEEAREVVRRVFAGEDRRDIAARYNVTRSAVDTHVTKAVRRNDPPTKGPHRGRDWSWLDDARCRGRHGFTEMAVWDQQKVCADCTVRRQCFERGLGECLDGWPKNEGPVYGGATPAEMKRLKKKQRQVAS